MPAKRLITLHTPRIAHLVAVLVMLMASASVMVAPDAPVNRHTPRGPYDPYHPMKFSGGIGTVR